MSKRDKFQKKHKFPNKNPLDKNKWMIQVAYVYKVGDQEVTRFTDIAIPPTKGNRTDILTTTLKYYYGITKKEFMERETKEEYVRQKFGKDTKNNPKQHEKDIQEAIKKCDWTSRLIEENIELIIEIKKGVVTIKGK